MGTSEGLVRENVHAVGKAAAVRSGRAAFRGKRPAKLCIRCSAETPARRRAHRRKPRERWNQTHISQLSVRLTHHVGSSVVNKAAIALRSRPGQLRIVSGLRPDRDTACIGGPGGAR